MVTIVKGVGNPDRQMHIYRSLLLLPLPAGAPLLEVRIYDTYDNTLRLVLPEVVYTTISNGGLLLTLPGADIEPLQAAIYRLELWGMTFNQHHYTTGLDLRNTP